MDCELEDKRRRSLATSSSSSFSTTGVSSSSSSSFFPLSFTIPVVSSSFEDGSNLKFFPSSLFTAQRS